MGKVLIKTGFPPICNPSAKLLILGSMPSEASLKHQQYYAHPQNAFWPIMASLCGFVPEETYQTRVSAIQGKGIAVWDVLQSCQRDGSLDSAIVMSSAVENDFKLFFEEQPLVSHIFFNGALAEKEFRRKVLSSGSVGEEIALTRLPSTSPAMAQLSPAKKKALWLGRLRQSLGKG